MLPRIDLFDLYHFTLGAICLAAFVIGCAPLPNETPDDAAPPAVNSTANPAPLNVDGQPKVDIDIGGGNGVDVDVERRPADNAAH